jgi:ferredoxin
MLPETSTPNPTDALATFGDDVLSLYRRGVAESELCADELVARSLMPPGSAAGRDFSSLAPTLPAFLPDACTGCMACVNVCPDSALHATVVPAQQLADAAASFFSGDPADADAAAVLARFTDTVKYGRQAERRGLEPAKFGLFVDATKCKGCAECVDVCPAAALRMTDKLADEGNGRSARWGSTARCRRRQTRIGQTRSSPTSCWVSTRMAMSAVPDRAPAAVRRRRSG